jgi:TolB-like protein/DNA-binding winged helix-turn-helix (wHTH) protein/tetratricopeptide (TPR) repeat protein
MTVAVPRETLRFGDFELDRAAYELRRGGRPVKLGRQPMELLLLLVDRQGQLVSRGEIVDLLWGKDVFVDVETGINTAISKIRQALRDSADAPMFLETVPAKGYRFVATVETARTGGTVAATVPEPPPLARPRGRTTYRRAALAALLAGFAIAIVAGIRYPWRASASPMSLAVLPVQNLGSDPQREYVAAGLTDEMSASLAQIDPERLMVKGRTLSYKGTTKTVAELGAELSVDYLVESSIQAEGSRLRITVTLIRVADQAHVWSQSYDREAANLLGLQQELSSAIAEQVSLRLVPERASGLERRQTHSADAYDAYLRARDQAHRRTPEGNALAITLFKRAIDLDPNYSLAWSELALTYAAAAINGDARPADVSPLAREAARHAVRANARLSEAQLALGYVLWLMDWDWKASEAPMRMAVDLDPSNAAAHRILGHALSQFGRQSEAEVEMRRARELDPFDPIVHALSGQIALQARDLSASLVHARKAIAIDPSHWVGYVVLSQALEASGDHGPALEALADAERTGSRNSKIPALKGYVLAKSGRVESAREVLRTLDAASRDRYVPPYAAALVYAGLGEPDPMFASLEKAYLARDVHLMYLPVDMKWDPYRRDARFVDLLARCGFASGQ